jgi:hypothetical protein
MEIQAQTRREEEEGSRKVSFMSAMEMNEEHNKMELTGKIHCRARGIRQDHSSVPLLNPYVAPATMMEPIDQLSCKVAVQAPRREMGTISDA